MIHHLIPSSPYTTRFLQLLEDHPDVFPPHEHVLWIERPAGDSFEVTGTGRIRCHYVGSWGFLIPCLGSSRDDRVIIHQLSNPRLLLHLSLFRWTARRFAWVFWGGDIYYFLYRPKTWPHALREALRKWVIPAIPLIGGLVPGDFETLRTVYGTRARYVSAFYPIPMDGRTLEPGASTGAEGRTVTVLVGNSGDPSNQHEWVFRSLARFRSEGVRILSPLSYGDPAYVASVIALGHELFGDQFTPLTEFLPPEQYARLIRDVDVAIMNHGYQQALGNIIAMLMLGKKVFVRSDTTTYRYFHDLGITVHDTLRITESTLAELLEFAPETGTRNAESIRHQLSEASAVAGWRRLFDSVRGPAVNERAKLVIWGASGHAKVVADIVRLRGDHEIVGFLDDRDPAVRPFFGSQVLGGRDRLPSLREQGVSRLLFGFGDGAARLELTPLVLGLGFTLATAIHPSAVVAADVRVGAGCVVGAGAVVGPGTRVGENVIVNTLAGVDHDCVLGDGAHVCPGARLGGWAEAGECAWVGIGATVRDRVKIGKRAVIGAGAVVLHDVPDAVVAYGVPARVIRGS